MSRYDARPVSRVWADLGQGLVEIDGDVSWSVSRTLSGSGLPGQARATSGSSVGSGSIEVMSESTPWTPQAIAPGGEVRIEASPDVDEPLRRRATMIASSIDAGSALSDERSLSIEDDLRGLLDAAPLSAYLPAEPVDLSTVISSIATRLGLPHDVQPSGVLVASVRPEGRSAWDVIQWVAKVTLGACWLDEDGTLVYRGPAAMRGQGAVVETIHTLEDVEDLPWEIDTDEVADRVEVTYTPVLVERSTTQTLDVWEGTEVIEVAAGATVTFEQDLDVVVSDLASWRPVWDTSVAANRFSRWAASTQPDGGGPQPPSSALSVTSTLLSGNRVRISVTNTTAATLYVSGGRDTQRLLLRANGRATTQAAVTLASGADKDAARSTTSLDLGVGITSEAQARSILGWLAAQTAAPAARLSGINVIPSAERRLGDIVEVLDPVTQANVRCVISGIRESGSDGVYEQSLDLTIVDPTPPSPPTTTTTVTGGAGISTPGGISSWETERAVEADLNDMTPPSVPSAPTLSARLGVLSITWNGLSNTGGVVSSNLSHVEVALSTTAGATTVVDRIERGGGTVHVTGLPYNALRYVRLRGVSRNGVTSAWSAERSHAVTPLVDADLIETTIQDQIDAVQQVADAAQTTANGRNRVIYSTATPSGTGTAVGDTWWRRDGAGRIIGQWEWTGSGWTPRTIESALIANLDAGKITTGSLDAARIDAGTITASKLLVAGVENIVPNGAGELGAPIGWGNLAWDTDAPGGLPGSFRCEPGQGTLNLLVASNPSGWAAVQPSTEYLLEVWVRADKPDSLLYIEYRDQTGAHALAGSRPADDGGVNPGGGYYIVGPLTVPTTWTRYSKIITTTATASQARLGGLYFNHPNGVERGAQVWIAGLRIRPRTSSALIVDGGITTRTLDALAVTADKIAANAITADKISAGSITSIKIASNAITTDKIAAGAVTAEKVVIAAQGNMIPWQPAVSIAPHGSQNGTTLTAVDDPDIGWCIQVSGGALADGVRGYAAILRGGHPLSKGGSSYVEVEEGIPYRASIGFGAGGNYPAGLAREARIVMTWYNAALGYISDSVGNTVNVTSFTGTQLSEVTATAPAGAAYLLVRIQKNFWSFGTLFLSNARVTPAAGGSLIVDGAITADKIASGAITTQVLDVLSSDHAAGIPAVRISGAGVRLYDPEGTEVVSLTATGGQYLTLRGGNGEATATIDDTGGAAFETLTVAGETRVDGVLIIGGDPIAAHGSGDYGPVINGRDLLGKTFVEYVEEHPNITDGYAWLTGLSHGQVVNAWRSEGDTPLTINASGGNYYLMRLQATHEFISGRVYEIAYSTPSFKCTSNLSTSNNGFASVVRYTTGTTGLGANTGSVVTGTRRYGPASGSSHSLGSTTTVRCPEDIPAGQVTLGISFYVYSGRTAESVETSDQNRWELAIRDGGVRRTANQGVAVNLTASTTPPAPPPPQVKQYTTTWNVSWSESYNGSNTPNSAMAGKLAQGRTPYATSQGVMRSLAGFPSLTGTLSGADIVKIEIYVYAAHWHANSGGTLCIGVHGHTSKPGTWSSSVNDVKRQKLKKPEGRWITLPSSVHAGFKSGAYRGVSFLPPGSSTSTEYYGYLTASKTKIRITYKK